MDSENGRRLNTSANVADDRGETFTTPFSLVNCETSGSNRTERDSKLEGGAKISVSPHKEHVEPVYRNGQSHASVDSPNSVKHSSDVAHESFRPTDSPLIQVMERTRSPHPRKPSSTSPGTDTPTHWSVDSNESLFSIGMGNDSFSKDISLSISGEMCTAGEYLPRVSHKSPAAKGMDEEVKDVNEAVDKPSSDSHINTHMDSNVLGSTDPNASHHHSDEAFASALKTGRPCPLCKCLCCGKMDFSCRWASCKCKCKCFGWPKSWLSWPSCSRCHCPNLICASCYSWRRETKRSRSDS